ELTEDLFRVLPIVHWFLPTDSCRFCSSPIEYCRLGPSITRRVSTSINFYATRYGPCATVGYPFQIDALDGGSVWPPTPSLGCSGIASSAAVTVQRSSSSRAPPGRRSRGGRLATSSGTPRSG